jgi:hypothetical protein
MFISPEEAKAKGPGAFEPRMNIREEVEGTPKKGPWDALVESWYPRDLVGPNDLAPEDRVLRAESRPKLKRLSNATMNSTGDPLYDNYFSSNPVSQWENKNDPFGMLHGPGFGGIYGNPFAQTAYRTSQEAKLHQLEASDPTYGELPWWQKMQNSFNPTKYIDGRTQYGTIPSPLQPYNPTNINESPLPNDFMRRAPATGFPAESPESNAFFKAQDQEEKAKIATLSAQGDYYASSSTNPQEQQQLRTLSQVARAIASGPLNQIDPSLGTVVNQIDRSAVSANVKSLAGKLGMYTTFLK